jgi:exopolyphosphatase/guanosine-5'-triphosphate,3'-diphosphate pyrophosphatase
MALLLRLAASLDRRPAAVIAGLEVEPEASRGAGPTGLVVRLIPTVAPGEPSPDLSLERWSLRSCAPAVLEATGLRLRVPEP